LREKNGNWRWTRSFSFIEEKFIFQNRQAGRKKGAITTRSFEVLNKKI
jgi:hypothetical protein